MVARQGLTKSTGFVPSLDCARRIDDQDNALAISAAVYRAETKLAELRSRYEEEGSRIRSAMLAEIGALEIEGGE